MIRGYTDHAANERTFLAWVRTGIAVIAFGFVIEKFTLFVLAAAGSATLEAAPLLRSERLSGPLGHYGGLGVMAGGLVLIVVATLRFLRIERMLDDPEAHEARGLRGELVLSAAIVLAAVAFSMYLVVG
jgi:putative membrane protein